MFAVTPDWDFYGGRQRLTHSAWDLLIEKDVLEITLKEVARHASVSPSLFHREYKTKTALFAEVADAALRTLLVNLRDDVELEECVNTWIRFAHARPRHYGLMFAFEYAGHGNSSMRRNALVETLSDVAESKIGFKPTRTQAITVLGMVHGIASLTASGMPRPHAQPTAEAIDAYLRGLKRSK